MSSNIAVSISADTTKLTAQLAVAKADLAATTAELRKTAQAMRDAGSGASDDLKVGLSQAAEAAAKAQASVSGLRARLADTLSPLNAVSAAGEHQAGIFREKMVMAHEALMGNYSRLIGSSMVLAERTGGIGAAFATIVNPTTLVIGAVLAVAGGFGKLVASAEEAERSLNKLKDSFAAIGHGGRMSDTGIEEMVTRIARLPGVNREAAEQIVTEFARTRQIGGDLFRALAGDIDRSARVMGVEAPEAAKTLAAAFADPARGARDLDGAYNILTAAQLRQIETLQRQGDRIGAQSVLIQAWKARLAELPPGLTQIQTATNALGNAWDNLTHAVGETESWKSARDAVAGLFNTLAQGMNLMSGATTAVPKIPLEGQIRETEKSVQTLTRRLDEMHRTASRPIDIQYVEDLLARTEKRLADLKAQSQQVDAARSRDRDAAAGDQVAESRKADLTDPALLTQQQKVRDIEDVITRLKNEQVGATDQEKARLQEIVAMKEKEKSDLLKGDTGSTPSQMEQWRAELAAKRAALQAEHGEEADWRLQDYRLEVAFWAEKSRLAKAGSKEAVEAARAESDARRQVHQEELAEAKRAAQEKREIDRQDADTDLAIAKIGLAEKRQILDEEVAAGCKTAADKLADLRRFTEDAYRLDLKRLQDELATLSALPKEHDRVYNEIRKLKAQHDADMASLSRQAAQEQEKEPQATARAWEQALAPVERAFDTSIQGMIMGTQTLRQAVARMAQSILAEELSADTKWLVHRLITNNAVAASDKSTATGGLLAWAFSESAKTAATTSGAATRTAAENAGNVTWFGKVGQMLAEWLGFETAKTAETVGESGARASADATASAATIAAAKAQAAGTIPAYAAEAAAAAMQSVAAIPIVGWAMAPAVGAETFAAAMSYLPMASAAGGWDRVPYDGALAELHKDEMVLPASIAGPLRAMTMTMPVDAGSALQSLSAPIATTAGAPNAATSTGAGPIVVQLNVQATDAASFNNRLQQAQTRNAIVQTIQRAVANGASLQPSR